MGIEIHGTFEVNGKVYNAIELQRLLDNAAKVNAMEERLEYVEDGTGVKKPTDVVNPYPK